jgi:hypothetical protein
MQAIFRRAHDLVVYATSGRGQEGFASALEAKFYIEVRQHFDQ